MEFLENVSQEEKKRIVDYVDSINRNGQGSLSQDLICIPVTKQQIQQRKKRQQTLNKIQGQRKYLAGKVVAIIDGSSNAYVVLRKTTGYPFSDIFTADSEYRLFSSLEDGGMDWRSQYFDDMLIQSVPVLENIVKLSSQSLHTGLQNTTILYDEKNKTLSINDFMSLQSLPELVDRLGKLHTFHYYYPLLLTICTIPLDGSGQQIKECIESLHEWFNAFTRIISHFSTSSEPQLTPEILARYVMNTTPMQKIKQLFIVYLKYLQKYYPQMLNEEPIGFFFRVLTNLLRQTERKVLLQNNLWIQEYDKYLEQENITKEDCQDLWSNENLKKLDLYSFAVCLLSILPNDYLADKSSFKLLLLDMIHPDPDKQIPPEEIVEAWKKSIGEDNIR